ncbi:DUF4320 family protein [Aminipila butyrica]|uniref:DUF4320 family protein n=1 Tax=Aminipila butyrica TaxID=433296 RepID=A0A858BXG5_9FIRM|nr:DUF4320 family protein [Aminipila butyrica]QIB69775.1 DUF4320 family protein [Aminipila butyrica]
MFLLKKIRRLVTERSGDMGLPLMIFTLIAVIIFLFGLEVFSAAIKYQNVTYSSKSIAKVIESDGAVTERAYEQMEALNKSYNMDMTFEVSDVTYFNTRDRSIQFRDPFTVNVRYTASIQLASPLFLDPLVWDINMKADTPGMSEVYWK